VSLHDWPTAEPHVSARPFASHTLLDWDGKPAICLYAINPVYHVRGTASLGC
jgi:hypothetical protein